MEQTVLPVLPIFLFLVCAIGLALGLLAAARIFNPGRPGRVKRMPYESGMDPIHDTRRRFDVRFYLLAIAFLVFDVELLFLYPWAVAAGQMATQRNGGRRAEVRETAEGGRLRAENSQDWSEFRIQGSESRNPPSALRLPPFMPLPPSSPA